jgi:hypothetical protein
MTPSSREILIDIPYSRVRATPVEDESERSFDFRHEETNTKDQLLQLQSELQRRHRSSILRILRTRTL